MTQNPFRVLASVTNKDGLAAFMLRVQTTMQKHGRPFELLSTGGTAKALREDDLEVVDVAAYTDAPEILDGRVKTLHPKIHGGLLGRDTREHRAEMFEHGIKPIDLLVVNLYPFRETVAQGAPDEVVIENIDIGGPSMIRSAAKNHERVTVIVDPRDYEPIIRELAANGTTGAWTRRRLALKAFEHTADYDNAIAAYLQAHS